MLWWQIVDSAIVDNDPIQIFLTPYEEDATHWNAARVKVTSDTIGTQYLDIEYSDFPGERFDQAYVGWNSDGTEWGTGDWRTQSPLDGIDAASLNGASFQIQIGQVTYDENLDVTTFIVLAETDSVAKDDLSPYLYERGTLNPPGLQQWTPIYFHSVPEPKAILLIVLGLTMLSLRRNTPSLCRGC